MGDVIATLIGVAFLVWMVIASSANVRDYDEKKRKGINRF